MTVDADDQVGRAAAPVDRRSIHRLWSRLGAGPLAILAVMIGIGVTFPASAFGFPGEDLVVTESPSGRTLTGPAEALIRNPTFLREADEVAEEALDKPGLMQRLIAGGGGWVRLAKVMGWVGGAVLANEICNSIFDACIQIGGEPDPPRGTITWSYAEQATTVHAFGGYQGAPVTAYTVPPGHYHTEAMGFNETYDPNCASPNRPYPLAAATGEIDTVDANCNDGLPNPPFGRVDERIVLRSENANRKVIGHGPDTAMPNASTTSAYCPSAGPGALSCSSTPTSNWKDRIAQALAGEIDAMGLTAGELAQLGQYIAHQLDPRCHPNPFASTVDVPEVLADETPAHYQGCLETLDLESSVTTLNATDTTVANGAVVGTEPEGGTRVARQTEVEVVANPAQASVTRRDPRCELGGAPGPDPGEAPDDGSGYRNYQHVEGSPYPVSVDPTGSSPPVREMPLRWGTKAWGWRHILVGHSYSTWDRAQTIAALATDTTPSFTGKASTVQWDFRLSYTVLDNAVTVQCKRTVRVEYYVDPNAQSAGLTGIRGIQNSFVGSVVAGGGAP